MRAKIESLQAIIRPHFGSIPSTVLRVWSPATAQGRASGIGPCSSVSSEPGHARQSDLVGEELELAKRYLSIEQYRLGKRLQLDWDVSAIPDDLPIPQLTLQPLLENALIYGIAPRVEGGVVKVEADYIRGVFILRVSNPYDEVARRQTSSGTQQALANIGARITALFGPLASLSVERRDGRHFTCLRYPCARLTQEARAI